MKKSPLEKQELFRLKAIKVHGDRYDYSQSVYVDTSTKLTILCQVHGPFQQQPYRHLQGAICPKCSNKRLRFTKEHFESKARAVHGDRYDYSQSVYLGAKKKITILCKEHGPFEQLAFSHLQGYGCTKCANLRRYCTQEQFEIRARKKHGDRYDYSQSVYLGVKKVITIICKEHGPFEQLPNIHILGKNCPSCTLNEKLNSTVHRRVSQFSRFEAKAKKIHNDRYDYSQSIYVDSKTKITILCKEHGPFERTPMVHLVGLGCPNCPSISKLNYG